MRVVGVHPAREPVAAGAGPIHIGSAPDDAITLSGAGVAPGHLSLVADARGLVLEVRSGCERVYVNARAVYERALLHYGDTVTLGANRVRVTADADPGVADALPAAGTESRRATLRVASGTESGRMLAIAPVLRLGAGTRYGGSLAHTCRVAQTVDGLWFETDGDDACVNGWPCRRARLAAGDQLVVGGQHFIVEAPADEYAARMAALPPPPPPPLPEVVDDGPHTEVWWLIVAAAALAAIIALFLYFRW
ncbi:MAG TPA: FHA domain-containing protein [Rhodanobacteraceae bacterium]